MEVKNKMCVLLKMLCLILACILARTAYFFGYRPWFPVGYRGGKAHRGKVPPKRPVYVRETTWVTRWYRKKLRWLSIELDFYIRNHHAPCLDDEERWQFMG